LKDYIQNILTNIETLKKKLKINSENNTDDMMNQFKIFLDTTCPFTNNDYRYSNNKNTSRKNNKNTSRKKNMLLCQQSVDIGLLWNHQEIDKFKDFKDCFCNSKMHKNPRAGNYDFKINTKCNKMMCNSFYCMYVRLIEVLNAIKFLFEFEIESFMLKLLPLYVNLYQREFNTLNNIIDELTKDLRMHYKKTSIECLYDLNKLDPHVYRSLNAHIPWLFLTPSGDNKTIVTMKRDTIFNMERINEILNSIFINVLNEEMNITIQSIQSIQSEQFLLQIMQKYSRKRGKQLKT
jgi:hypothetical protein